MAHLQYVPGDPRLVDQLVYELKSKGIFDQFRKDCIADVDTRPAYQNLRQRVENSVSTFLSRQCWKPELNKNQLREKLRKHILDGNYLEQGVERIVDQVVNPKVASVFIPQVEDLVYNYLGVPRKKTNNPENSETKTEDLLPTDLEAVSPGSVNNDDKDLDQDLSEDKMEVDEPKETKDDEKIIISEDSEQKEEKSPTINNFSNNSLDKLSIPTPSESIRIENIPPPDNSPPKIDKIDLEKIELPKEPYVHPNLSTSDVGPDEIPLPKDNYFKPLCLNSEDDSSSDSSLRRNMSPLTPIRNYNNENSCDAQQAFENDSDSKSNDKKEPSSFRFAIETKSPNSDKKEKKDDEQINLSSQFNQVNINAFNTPLYDDSSNSNNLQIDYESDANSKANTEKNQDGDQDSQDKKDKKEERRSSHKSSHRSRDSHRHSSSKDKRSDSKHSTSRDSSRHEKKKDDHRSKSSHKEREKSKDRNDKKDSRDSSKHKSSSHKSSSHKDSKSHRSSSSRPSDKKSDEKRSSSSHRSSDKSSSRSTKDKTSSRDSKPSSNRDKDRKSKKPEEKDKKKDKKDTDDHYSLSGRGNHNRRSTDRDSNDGSSSSKGSQNQPTSKTEKKESKESSTKSSTPSSESTSPSDSKEVITNANNASNPKNQKPIRVEEHLETPITSPPRLPFVPDVTLKKPKFAANLAEAKRMMKMRKFLDEEQKRMNQEAALLLEFQANVRPSLSQVYSSIPGPELEFACLPGVTSPIKNEETVKPKEENQNLEEQQDETKTYNENKPFSQLMDEIIQYSKASEMKKDVVIDKEDEINTTADKVDEEKAECKIEEQESQMDLDEEAVDTKSEDKIDTKQEPTEDIILEESNTDNKAGIIKDIEKEIVTYKILKDETKNTENTEFFEVTIITEELSETEDTIPETINTPNETIIKENSEPPENSEKGQNENQEIDNSLKYFTEQEKYDAELKRHQYNAFLKTYIENSTKSNKIFVINCDTYEENVIKEIGKQFGYHDVINYYKNGHLKLPKVSPVIKNVNLISEISLPVEIDNYGSTNVFSPVKSECSFELSSDYDAKLEEMVNKTSRQQVMEIILGNIESENMTVNYCSESDDLNLKRKLVETESLENNNMEVMSKMRKMSDSDQISSTTEEPVISNNNQITSTRSKYLGRARRVGLPRPRRTNLPNSPSSDKSVENYEQNTPTTPNGKLKITRTKVQRYDKSDLYKPKLHYLSRRNNIS